MKIKSPLVIIGLLFVLTACSTVHYDHGYAKDGVREGFEPDLEVCKAENPDSASARDGCMSDKGWTRSDAIKVDRGE
ncbi:hypothetical protein QWI17_06400 [Gilvimarinus sp. SDUM040013]|nr:hypothetical protein [Gilvimarinus sp. SDUM040013]MDO3385469.1 hypothetical protein [Gilvimarinus sp. SDUM040013]